MNVVPFGEGSKHAEDEHEQHEVKQAEEHRREGRSDHGACRYHAEYREQRDGAVEADGNNREQHGGRDGHEHVVARKALALRVGENAFEQFGGIVPKHLIEAFRPTESLVPGVDEGNGLLVVEHSGGAIGDTTAFDNGARGKLDILREQVPFPAAAFFEHAGGNEEARSRNSAARVERQARLAQIFRLA